MKEKRTVKTVPFGRVVSRFSLNLFYRLVKSNLFKNLDFREEETRTLVSDQVSPIID